MRKTILSLFLALLASTGTVFSGSVKIDDLFYSLYASGKTAMVISSPDHYSDLTNIIIPSSVTYAGDTYTVTSIGIQAFFYCSGLTSIEIPNSVTRIGKDAFSGCTGLTSVTIGNGVTSIGDDAFYGCSGLTSIEIPNSVTSIGNWAFYNCSGLTSVTIPNSVTSIGRFAFEGCTGLTSVTIPNSVTSIGEGAFYGCTGLTSVTIPNSVTRIGKDAFSECTGLTSVTISNSVTSIGDGAFYKCSGLTSVTIGNSVTSIGDDAFEGCSSLISVTIPNSVTSIGNRAFNSCTSLISITIPENIRSTGKYSFNGCNNLQSVIWNAINCTTYEDDKYVYPPFDYCPNITSFTIGNKVKTIPDVLCAGLPITSIEIPNSVTSIGYAAFADCTGLTSVTIGNSVTSIGDDAFEGCSSLISVTIPNSVTGIGYAAFYGCTGLTSITCEAIRPPTCISTDVFSDVNKSIPLYVPAGSVNAYKTAYIWKDFGKNIKPIQAAESTVTEIQAEPTDNSVIIEWPAVIGATEYIIQIWKGDEFICMLSFNEQGQLLSISFEKKAGNGASKTATQTATGWQYTIGSLDAGTEYTYKVVAKNGDTELFKDEKQFTTTMTTAIDKMSNDKMSKCENAKIMRDGVLYILRDGVLYNAQGARVK